MSLITEQKKKILDTGTNGWVDGKLEITFRFFAPYSDVSRTDLCSHTKTFSIDVKRLFNFDIGSAIPLDGGLYYMFKPTPKWCNIWGPVFPWNLGRLASEWLVVISEEDNCINSYKRGPYPRKIPFTSYIANNFSDSRRNIKVGSKWGSKSPNIIHRVASVLHYPHRTEIIGEAVISYSTPFVLGKLSDKELLYNACSTSNGEIEFLISPEVYCP